MGGGVGAEFGAELFAVPLDRREREAHRVGDLLAGLSGGDPPENLEFFPGKGVIPVFSLHFHFCRISTDTNFGIQEEENSILWDRSSYTKG